MLRSSEWLVLVGHLFYSNLNYPKVRATQLFVGFFLFVFLQKKTLGKRANQSQMSQSM